MKYDLNNIYSGLREAYQHLSDPVKKLYEYSREAYQHLSDLANEFYDSLYSGLREAYQHLSDLDFNQLRHPYSKLLFIGAIATLMFLSYTINVYAQGPESPLGAIVHSLLTLREIGEKGITAPTPTPITPPEVRGMGASCGFVYAADKGLLPPSILDTLRKIRTHLGGPGGIVDGLYDKYISPVIINIIDTWIIIYNLYKGMII